tara:strand:+ start:204 stop:401 length:198 start_codon:yes stop_codon:yes gene_type:complete
VFWPVIMVFEAAAITTIPLKKAAAAMVVTTTMPQQTNGNRERDKPQMIVNQIKVLLKEVRNQQQG